MSRPCHMIAFESPIGEICVAESDGSVIGIGIGTTGEEEFEEALVRRGYAPGKSETAVLRRARRQLRQYLSGRGRDFSFPIRLEGTPFQKAVWTVVRMIPYGGTLTYGEIAAAIGFPKGARAVGQAVGSNRLAIVIPCHRVVAAGGRLGGFGCGLDVKRFLLELEHATGVMTE